MIPAGNGYLGVHEFGWSDGKAAGNCDRDYGWSVLQEKEGVVGVDLVGKRIHHDALRPNQVQVVALLAEFAERERFHCGEGLSAEDPRFPRQGPELHVRAEVYLAGQGDEVAGGREGACAFKLDASRVVRENNEAVCPGDIQHLPCQRVIDSLRGAAVDELIELGGGPNAAAEERKSADQKGKRCEKTGHRL